MPISWWRVDLVKATFAVAPKHWYDRAMEALFGHPDYKNFVLQDHKRLPARFFARISGTLLARLY